MIRTSKAHTVCPTSCLTMRLMVEQLVGLSLEQEILFTKLKGRSLCKFGAVTGTVTQYMVDLDVV